MNTCKLMKRGLSRKEFKKVMSQWINDTKNLRCVDESKLEVKFVMAHDCESLVRCASTKMFKFKSFAFVQESNNTPFLD